MPLLREDTPSRRRLKQLQLYSRILTSRHRLKMSCFTSTPTISTTRSRRWESILPSPLLLLLLGALLCSGDDGFDIDREIHQPIILYVSGVPLHVVIGVYEHTLTHIHIDIYAYIHTCMRRIDQKNTCRSAQRGTCGGNGAVS